MEKETSIFSTCPTLHYVVFSTYDAIYLTAPESSLGATVISQMNMYFSWCAYLENSF